MTELLTAATELLTAAHIGFHLLLIALSFSAGFAAGTIYWSTRPHTKGD